MAEHATHKVVVKFKELEVTYNFEASLSGIVNNPDQLWIVQLDGKKTYFMLSEILWYSVGGS